MLTVHSIEAFPPGSDTVVTMGAFDGIHLGHQEIIRSLTRAGDTGSKRSVLITFDPHPQEVLRPGSVEILTTIEEKIEILRQFQLDILLILPFTAEFSKLEPADFVEEILFGKLSMRTFVLGFDHTFGRRKSGDKELLCGLSKTFGFSVEEVTARLFEKQNISSTHIREMIKNGQVDLAAKNLGRHYGLSGRVVHGRKLGQGLGFPTANILPEHDRKLIPGNGIYACRVRLHDRIFNATTHIGYSPTLKGEKKEIEVHIHQFSERIYSERLHLEFIQKIRDEMEFENKNKLISQIKLDKQKSSDILSNL